MGEEGSFLLFVILGWFASTFWCSFSERHLSTIRGRIADCHRLLINFFRREILIRTIEKKTPDQIEKMLEETNKTLGKAVQKTRSDLALAVDTERDLVLKIRARTESLTEFGHGASAISADQQLNNFQLLLGRKIVDVELLRKRLVDLEDAKSSAYTKQQVYAAKAAADLSSWRANYFLRNSNSEVIDGMFEQQKVRLEQTEARALEVNTTILEQVSKLEIEKWDSQNLDNVSNELDSAIRQLKQELSILSQAEAELRQLIETARKNAETWKARGEMAGQQGNSELTGQAFERSRPFIESAKLLAEQMPLYEISKLKLQTPLNKLEKIREKLEQNHQRG